MWEGPPGDTATAICLAASAAAALSGFDFVAPHNVADVAEMVLAHRFSMQQQGWRGHGPNASAPADAAHAFAASFEVIRRVVG